MREVIDGRKSYPTIWSVVQNRHTKPGRVVKYHAFPDYGPEAKHDSKSYCGSHWQKVTDADRKRENLPLIEKCGSCRRALTRTVTIRL